jgi:hypothetical protein
MNLFMLWFWIARPQALAYGGQEGINSYFLLPNTDLSSTFYR